MKTRIIFSFIGLAIAFTSFKPSDTKSYSLNATKTNVKVTGTSTLHDWESLVKKVDGTAAFELNEDNYVKSVSSLTVNFYTNSFSSGKSLMDEKTTEALKATTYPKITYVLSQVTAYKIVSGVQQISATGNLSIGGVTMYITTTAYCKVNTSGEVNLFGKQSIDMTQYGIDPPTAMLGTLKTGKDISVIYSLYFN